MHKKILTILALLMVPAICSSCQFMPVEEELPVAPVIRAYEAKEYKLTTVMRGDIALTETMTCTYKPANKESLSFELVGEQIKNVYVQKGDSVKAGTLLAELESGNLQEQIHVQEYELEKAKSQLVYAQNELLKETAINEGLPVHIPEKEASDKRLVDLALALEAAEDAVYIKELQLADSRKDLSARQIYAGIDGTISYIKSFVEGQRSEANKIFCTVSDMSTSVFMVEGDKADYFSAGMEVVISYKGTSHEAVVIDASKMVNSLEPGKKAAYMELKQPDPTLESGSNGKVTVVHDSRENVLFINKRAVKSANGEQFVYMLDENGLRYMQYVTTGLEANEYIEIMDGLSEGDSVVLE